MEKKKTWYILVLVTMFIMLVSNVALAQGEAPAPPAFTGTVFSLLFLYVAGVGVIVLYGLSKNTNEPKSYKKNRK